MNSLFDQLFYDSMRPRRFTYSQPQVYVVSEESLARLEKENTERRIEEINLKIERLTEARETLTESLNLLAPAKEEVAAWCQIVQSTKLKNR